MKHLFSDHPGDDGVPGSERRFAIAALIVGTLIAVLDGSIVNVALPVIGATLHSAAADAVWVANAYLLAGAMSLMAFAALGEVVGFARVYSVGLVVFTLSSLGCALSDSLPMLVGMRFVQGLGGAAAMSLGPALYRTVVPTRLLGTALGINALVVASATAAGPTLGGFLLEAFSWQWLFAINVPLGAVAVWLAHRSLPMTRSGRRHIDLPSVLLSALAMGALVIGVDDLSHWRQAGGAGHRALYLLATTLVCGSLFLARQRRAAAPLLPLQIFASRRFSMAAATSMCSFTGQGIAFIALPFLFQGAMGYTALQSAGLFTPWPLAIVIAAPLAGRLADRMPPARLSTGGLAVLALGLGLLALLPDDAGVADILWRAFVCGLGFGFFQSPNNRELMGSAPRTLSGTASGVLSTVRTLGQALGAAMVAILLASLAHHGAGGARTGGTLAPHVALWIAAGCAAAATVVSALRIRHAQQSD